MLKKAPPGRKANIREKIDWANKVLIILQKNLADAQAALATALEKARQSLNDLDEKHPIKKLQAIVDALTAEITRLKTERETIQKELETLKKVQQEVITRISVLENRVQECKKDELSVIAHENEHRAICYFFTDKLTEILNKLRVWGYAVDPTQAGMLAQKHFKDCLATESNDIFDEARKKQKYFDDLTEHGKYPGRWDRSKELK